MHPDSHVGISALYTDGIQHTEPVAEVEARRRNHENPPLSSRRGSLHKKEQALAKRDSVPTEEELTKKDPTAPARFHGHEPSKGAKIDAELLAEEEALLRKKENQKKEKGNKGRNFDAELREEGEAIVGKKVKR